MLIPYAELSDFFLVWLKRTLPAVIRYYAARPFRPRTTLFHRRHVERLVQDETKHVDGQPSQESQGLVRRDDGGKLSPKSRRVLRDDGVGSVVFAHKTTEGWEALLSGMIRGGWTITGSWPIATEMASSTSG